jgi:hypothetical protein
MQQRPELRRGSASRGRGWISRVRTKIVSVVTVVIGFILSLVAIQMIAHSL